MGDTIYLVGEHKDGQLKRVTSEILGELVKQGTAPVVVLLGASGLDALAADIGKKGAAKVVCLESPALETYTTEGYANALHAYLSTQGPAAIVTGATSQGKDFLPRLAAKFETGFAGDCTELKVNGGKVTVRRPVYAGKCSKQVEFLKAPAVFTVRPNVLPPAADKGTSAPVEKVAAQPGDIRAKLTQVLGGTSKKVDLTEADIIISGGRSLKSSDNFKILNDCAEVIGAAVGASRAAVDAGYAPHDMQVGQTGKTVSPKLYIACGISGAIQHLAGMRTSKVIVAINKDPEAPIFQKADYGVVGDLFEIVPLLTEEFKKLKAHS
jgi:electron transfer flavoprotein alpha subunit